MNCAFWAALNTPLLSMEGVSIVSADVFLAVLYRDELALTAY